MWYNRMLPETNWLRQVVLYQESRRKCYDFCQLVLARTLRPGQSYMSLVVFLPFRRYRQGHISGRSFKTYRLSRSPVNINREEGQVWSITFDHNDWPTENTNSLPLLAAWLKTTHGKVKWGIE
jgi:hypothetical protein